MIASFANKVTSDFFNGVSSARARRIPAQIREMALYKLDVLNAAQNLDDLRSPPGNRLEALRGDYSGKYSIRINGQWRIVFSWQGSNAHDVEIVDYH